MKIFSIKRALLSCLLGLLLPFCYAVLLSEAFDYARRPTPQFLAWPFGWPRPLLVLLLGRQPTREDIVGGLIFFAACNILLYGTVVYFALTMRSVVRSRRADYGPPPPPGRFPPAAE